MGPYFQEWRDDNPSPQRINSKTWFHRLSRTPCPTCDEEYDPELDRQRYCVECKVWYHVECLGENNLDVEEDDSNDAEDAEDADDAEDAEDKEVLQLVDVEELDAEGLPKAWEVVLEAPTVRGHHGVYNFDNNWLNTGSGTQKRLVEEWKAEKRAPDDWMVQLGENFLTDLASIRFKRYTCVNCQATI